MDLSEVNEEILLNIFDYLPFKDVLSVERVCQDWKRIANDEHSWKERFQFLSQEPYFISPYLLKQQQLQQQNTTPTNNNNNSERNDLAKKKESPFSLLRKASGSGSGSMKTTNKSVDWMNFEDSPSKGKKAGKGKKKKDDWNWDVDDVNDTLKNLDLETKGTSLKNEKSQLSEFLPPVLPQINPSWYTKNRYRSILNKVQNVCQCRASITHFGCIQNIHENISGISKESEVNSNGVLVAATCNDLGIFDTTKMTLRHKFTDSNMEAPMKKRAVLVKRNKLVYATANNRAQLFSLFSMQPSTSFKGHSLKINLINWDCPGMLFTGSHDCTIKLWDTRMDTYVQNFVMLDRPLTMKILGDSFEAATMDGSYTTIDMRTSRYVNSLSITSKIPLEFLTVDNHDDLFGDDGSLRPTGMKVIGDTIVASISHLDLYKYDLKTGLIQKFSDLKSGGFFTHNFSCVAVSSSVVFAGLHQGIIKGWSLSTLRLLYFIRVSLSESVTAFSIEESSDSYSLIYGLSNGSIGVIDFIDQGEDYKIHTPVDVWASLPSRGVSLSKFVVTRNYVNKWPFGEREVDTETETF